MPKFLKGLAWSFLVGAGMRLIHAWYTFYECNNIWPAGGIKDFINKSNYQQNIVTIHVLFCTIWAMILFYQFYGALYFKHNILSLISHRTLGYIGLTVATIAAMTGWLSVWTLQLPSYVLFCIKTQLFFGAPAFYWEVIYGIIAMVKYKDWKRHKQHMILALIGTFADAGNGFSVYVSRKIFEGTEHQQWAQDVGVLCLNIISIFPFLIPGIGPHMDHILYSINWKSLKNNFFHNCTFWDITAITTVIGGTLLFMVHIFGLIYLFHFV